MNPIVIVVPMLMLSGKKKKRRKSKKRMLGDLSYSEASALMNKTSPVTSRASSPAIDFECYDCDSEHDLGMPLLDYDPEEDGELEEAVAAAPRVDDPERDAALARCDKFLDAVFVEPKSRDELAINEIAVRQTILPVMEKMAKDMRSSAGRPLDPEDHGMPLVLAGLEAIAPDCGWAFHEEDSAWTYAFGEPVEGHHVDVLESMFPLAVGTIDKINGKEEADNG